MKKFILLLILSLVLPMTILAQRNDIYSSGSNKKSDGGTVVPNTAVSTPIINSTVSTQPSALAERDADEYNRRYTGAPSDYAYEDEAMYIHDTIFIQENVSDTEAYAEGYVDASNDYEYALRMVRFHSPRSSVYISSPIYWDVVYSNAILDIAWGIDVLLDPWDYHWYSSYYYYDPWFYGYSYSPYYYSYWYDPWYDPWYNNSYYYGGYYGGSSNRYHDFVPNRSINTSWDRNLGANRRVNSVYASSSRSADRSLNTGNASSARVTSARSANGSTSSVRVTSPGVSSRSANTSSTRSLNDATYRSANSSDSRTVAPDRKSVV